MIFKVKDNVDVIDVIKKMKDGVAETCDIDMHEFDDDSESSLKTLLTFRKFIKDQNLDIKFTSFNGTLPKIRNYLKTQRTT